MAMLVNPSLSDNSAILVTPPILPLREYLSAPNIMELVLALQSVAFEVMVTLLSFLLHAAREYRISRIASYCKLSRLCGLPGRAGRTVGVSPWMAAFSASDAALPVSILTI